MQNSTTPKRDWTWTLEETIPSQAEAGKPILEKVMERLQAGEWGPHDLFGIHLAVEEALVNAIKHGNGYDPTKTVTIVCKLAHNAIRVEIEDEGGGFDPSKVPDPTEDDNLENPSGRGLMLMRNFMSHVEFNQLGNRVVLEKQREVSVAAP